jgi:TolB-like protein
VCTGFGAVLSPTSRCRPRVNHCRLPDKPSIAVLPLQNISGDPEQEYFADGMVEEIITSLSRIRWLFVIARNSAFVLLTAHRDDPATGVMTGLCSDCAQNLGWTS